MPDDLTPVDLRSRVGAYISTKYVDERTYLYENRHSGTLNLFFLEGARWTWVARAQTNPEIIGMVLMLRRMGVEVQQGETDAHNA
jgi:hypothetical protein